MSTTAERVPLPRAMQIARELEQLFAGVCHRIAVVGSVRRQCMFVGDVEILMVPRYRREPSGLFDEEQISLQLELAKKLRADGVLKDRLNSKGHACFGEFQQRALFNGFPVDLFCCEPEQWGVSMVVRTGDARFSRNLATQRSAGGFLPPGYKLKGWRLRYNGRPLPTPEELDVFNAIGKKWVPPEARSG